MMAVQPLADTRDAEYQICMAFVAEIDTRVVEMVDRHMAAVVVEEMYTLIAVQKVETAAALFVVSATALLANDVRNVRINYSHLLEINWKQDKPVLETVEILAEISVDLVVDRLAALQMVAMKLVVIRMVAMGMVAMDWVQYKLEKYFHDSVVK